MGNVIQENYGLLELNLAFATGEYPPPPILRVKQIFVGNSKIFANGNLAVPDVIPFATVDDSDTEY